MSTVCSRSLTNNPIRSVFHDQIPLWSGINDIFAIAKMVKKEDTMVSFAPFFIWLKLINNTKIYDKHVHLLMFAINFWYYPRTWGMDEETTSHKFAIVIIVRIIQKHRCLALLIIDIKSVKQWWKGYHWNDRIVVVMVRSFLFV